MFLRCRFFLLLLIFSFSVCQGACAQTQSFLPNDILISLEPGYSVFSDTWVAASQETVFLLIGNEDENEMRLAIAEQSSDGVYQVIAQSKKIISYEEYRVGHVEMMDK